MAGFFVQESGHYLVRHGTRLVVGARSITFAILLVTGSLATHATAEEVETLEWIQDVLLGTEYGEGEKVAVRWAASPTISVFGANNDQLTVVEEVVAELNDVLEETTLRKITRLAPGSSGADIEVIFAPLADFDRIARGRGFVYYPVNWGYFWVFWNERHEIFRAHVLLASDRLKGSHLRHFALEEITQVLGPTNDSAEFPESIFYASGMDGGAAQHLSQNDRELITFLYQHVLPGARQADVVAAYHEHWNQ